MSLIVFFLKNSSSLSFLDHKLIKSSQRKRWWVTSDEGPSTSSRCWGNFSWQQILQNHNNALHNHQKITGLRSSSKLLRYLSLSKSFIILLFYNMIVKTSQQLFNINGKNAFECPLRLGLYLKVECMNQSETNFSRTAQSQRFWQGAICHVWTFQLDKHWGHSQKERLAYKLVDK